MSTSIKIVCDHKDCETYIYLWMGVEVQFGKAYCHVHASAHGQCEGIGCFSKEIPAGTLGLCVRCKSREDRVKEERAVEMSENIKDRENREIGAALRLIVEALK